MSDERIPIIVGEADPKKAYRLSDEQEDLRQLLQLPQLLVINHSSKAKTAIQSIESRV